MHILDAHEMWESLSFVAKAYLLCLLMTSAYMSQSLLRILIASSHLGREGASLDAEKVETHLARLERSIENIRESQTMLLVLFGIASANEILAVLQSIRHSALSLSAAGVETFGPIARVALIVFGVLTFLHASQWATAVRLGKFRLGQSSSPKG